MAEKNAAEDILKRLQDAASSVTKQQTSILERYSEVYQKFLRGDLAQADLTKWAEFWFDEANRFAKSMTDLNVTYYKAMIDLGEQFSLRLEQMARTAKSAPKPSPAGSDARPAARAAAARKRRSGAARSARPAR